MNEGMKRGSWKLNFKIYWNRVESDQDNIEIR